MENAEVRKQKYENGSTEVRRKAPIGVQCLVAKGLIVPG